MLTCMGNVSSIRRNIHKGGEILTVSTVILVEGDIHSNSHRWKVSNYTQKVLRREDVSSMYRNSNGGRVSSVHTKILTDRGYKN